MANLILDLSVVDRISNKFLYKDIGIPVKSDFEPAYDLVAIQKSLNNIFTFRLGERILDPNFGNTINYHLYEIINDLTLVNVKTSIVKMLSYEPRIQTISIDVLPYPDDNQIGVTIKYSVPHINQIGTFSTVITISAK